MTVPAGGDSKAEQADVRPSPIQPGKLYYLKQLIWLRRLLWKRRWRSQSSSLKIIGSIAVLLGGVLGGLGFFVALGIGLLALPAFEASTIVVIFGFLSFCYLIMRVFSMVLNMQSGEGYPMDNVLHLPFTVRQIFYLNFAMAQLTVTTIIFLPILLGLAIGVTISLAYVNVLLIAYILVFVLFVSAIIYQFQTFLLIKIPKQRDRVLILTALSISIVLLMQAPNIYFNFFQRDGADLESQVHTSAQELQSLAKAKGLLTHPIETEIIDQGSVLTGWIIQESSPERFPWKLLMAIFVLGVLTALSLHRSYSKTLLRYQLGRSSSQRMVDKNAVSKTNERKKRFPIDIRRAVAYVTLRVYWRSAIGKLSLLMPLQVLVLAGITWLNFPRILEPDILPLALIGVVALSGLPIGIAFNLFALDGRGFSLYLQSGINLKYVLVGKFYATAPLFAFLSFVLLGLVVTFSELPVSYVFALVFQFSSVFLILSFIALEVSIQYPFPVALNSTNAKGYGVVAFVIFICELFTVGVIIFVAYLLIWMDGTSETGGRFLSSFLVGSILEFLIVLAFCRGMFNWLTKHMKARALAIHESVTALSQ